MTCQKEPNESRLRAKRCPSYFSLFAQNLVIFS